MTNDAHVDVSTPEVPGLCTATGTGPYGRRLPGYEYGVRIDRADRHILISDEIVSGKHADWAWHHRCEVAEGFVRITGDNMQVTYRLTGERGGYDEWHAVRVETE